MAEMLTETEKQLDMKTRLKIMKDNADQLVEHEVNYRATLDAEEKRVRHCLKKFKATIAYSYRKLENRIMSQMLSRRDNLSKDSSSKAALVEMLKEDIKRSLELLESTDALGMEIPELIEKDIQNYEIKIKHHVKEASRVSFCLVDNDNVSVKDISKSVINFYKTEEVITQSAFPVMSHLQNEILQERETSDDDDLPYQCVDASERNVRCGDVLVETKKSIRLRCQQHFPEYRANTCVMEREVVLERIIDLKEHNCPPRYCLWIQNYVVVSFQEERTLKLFDALTGRFLSSYLCQSQPWAMVLIDNLNFAVAYPYKNTINIMSIFKPYIKLVQAPIMSSGVWALAYHKQDKILLAASKDTDHIKKIHLDGRRAGKIHLNNEGKGVYNIMCDSAADLVYISCHSTNTVLCIDMNGTEIFEYQPPKISHPWTVVLFQNQIFITYYNGHCLRLLDNQGRLETEFLSYEEEDIDQPLGMCFNEKMNKFALLSAHKTYIQVFKILTTV